MLFNSFIFIFLFLPVTLTGWYVLNKLKSDIIPKVFLIIMSLVFYAYFNIKYLPIIVISIIVNYCIYLILRKSKKQILRKAVFIFGLVLNIGILFYYKYLGFFTENINLLFKTDFNVIKLLLPLGISFFTFQQLSFVIDSYKKEIPDYSILDYSLFVCFFPQLIAGPIVLHNEIIPQFADTQNKKLNFENLSRGVYAFVLGLAKKVLIADTLGNLVNLGYESIGKLNSTSAVAVMLAYTLQIYFDFSGYCDMATGIGYMFNIKLPVNFNSPYRALDMEDFWKRWHITLTRFLTRNLYIPLGGNRKGKFRTYLNQFIVFVVSGIWHGANWTFIFWGAINGIAVIISKLTAGKTKKLKSKAPFLFWIVTFIFINFAWIYFRADSISDANHIIATIFSFNFGKIKPELLNSVLTSEYAFVGRIIEKVMPSLSSIYGYLVLFTLTAFGIFAGTKLKNTNEQLSVFKPDLKHMLCVIVLGFWSVISLSGVSTFLYFNF